MIWTADQLHELLRVSAAISLQSHPPSEPRPAAGGLGAELASLVETLMEEEGVMRVGLLCCGATWQRLAGAAPPAVAAAVCWAAGAAGGCDWAVAIPAMPSDLAATPALPMAVPAL